MTLDEITSPFPGLRFARIVSLGGWEEPHAPRIADFGAERGILDRLVVPLDALGAMLADDGARLGEDFIASHEGTQARCGAYGVLYADALPRDGAGQIVFDLEVLERCRTTLQQALVATLGACEKADGPVLFLRRVLSTNLPWDPLDRGTVSPAEALEALVAALDRRFPGLDLRLLIAAPPAEHDALRDHRLDPRIVIVPLQPYLDASLPQRVEAETPPPAGDPNEAVWQAGLDLRQSGRSNEAVAAFARAYAGGLREVDFLRDYLGLLTGETRYDEVVSLVQALRKEGLADHPRAARHLAMLMGHAKLALVHARDREIALSAARAASQAWLDASALHRTIADAIAQRRPFSFIRVGDGEARFLLGETSGAGSILSAEEAHAMGDVVWENWFGQPLAATDPGRRAELRAAYEDAVRAADVLGVCDPERLRGDTGHYGYLAWQERWLRETLVGRIDLRFADALVHRQLNADDPFLAKLLEGQDALGVVSPHPALAQALGDRLRIGRVIGHTIPAEGRLPNAQETRSAGAHFPAVYDRLLSELSVPRPGCVFLVAAGLLGKIYCARIKALGGIALDIGALADAWMGHDTRNGQFADAPPLDRAKPGPSDAGMTVGCLSLGKTGSMALADAVRNAGFPDAVHLHFLGPRARAMKAGRREPMLDRANELARRVEDPDHVFRFVTAVRDPIARILSLAFYAAEEQRAVHGIDIVRNASALIAWWDANKMSRRDFWSDWFDDTFLATFGFDFRSHPFDHANKSLRYEAGQLRLLVLRQEDDRAAREAELGWLLDRDGVALRTINDAVNQRYEAAYRPFLETFVAPEAWLDTYYESEVVRHFYTSEERAAFRARWSDEKRPPSPRLTDTRREDGSDPAAARTILCLSMMKTGSTAITESLQEAALGEAVVHLHHLGPLARARLPALGRPVDEIAARLDDSRHRFSVVTCVRDPIARWISEVFHDAATEPSAAELIDDQAAFIARIESKKVMDYAALWFDDSLKTTFAFDFREHPFNHGRGSLRFASERLRLLVLRQEDTIARREAELGWLVGRDRVPLHRRNERSSGALAERYRAFRETFVAPDRWLDLFYDSDVVRHFYTRDERAVFRKQWGSRPATTLAYARFEPPTDLAAPIGANEPHATGSGNTMEARPSPEAAPAQATADPDLVRAELETLRARLREGHAVDFNDYAYRPRERDWRASAGAIRLEAIFAAGESAYAGLLERVCGFDDRFRTIPVLPQADQPHWENWWLPGLDAAVLYGLIATQAPRTYLEIGSGHSTRFVRQAIRDHGLRTRIVSIDPHPTEDIEALCDEVVRTSCEEASATLFASLERGDMLFFDGSHRSFQNSDVTVFFTEILPALAPGVLYGVHDVFLPYDYPESWTNRYYNEQYLLMAYLLGGAAGDEVVFPAHHVWRAPTFAPLRNRLFLGTKHLDWLTSSFWMRRAARP